MLKEYASVLKRLTIFGDLCLGVVSFYLGYLLKGKIGEIYSLSTYTEILPLFLIIWGGLLYLLGLYESFRIKSVSDILLTIWASAFLGIGIFGSVAYLLKIENISRIFVISIFLIAAVLTTVEKIITVLFFKYIRKKGYNYKNILIVGTGKRAQAFIDIIEMHSEWGFKIIGLLDMDPARKNEIIKGFKVLGTFDDLPNIVHNNVIDEVVFVVPHSWLDKMDEIMKFLKIEGLKVHFAVNYFELQFSKAKQTDLDGFPLLTLETISHNISHLLVKRLIDLFISGLSLVILSPLFLLIAVIIKFTSKGPVFFRQTRCSLNGRKFTLYKFRTMVENAEEKLKDLLALNEMEGPTFKMENDPRVTGAGRYLRKLSLDEFPQLWNVFKGDMSLVGPRPPIPSEVEKYEPWHRRKLSMRPGITCLWQVRGRNKIKDFNKWMELDLEYIDNWSLWLDLKILLATIPVVLFGIGAK